MAIHSNVVQKETVDSGVKFYFMDEQSGKKERKNSGNKTLKPKLLGDVKWLKMGWYSRKVFSYIYISTGYIFYVCSEGYPVKKTLTLII